MLALAVIAALETIALIIVAGAARALIREHARERNLILNQLLHATGRTWQPPPVEAWDPPPTRQETVRQPEQMPADLWDGD